MTRLAINLKINRAGIAMCQYVNGTATDGLLDEVIEGY